jgi:hypothetical protein
VALLFEDQGGREEQKNNYQQRKKMKEKKGEGRRSEELGHVDSSRNAVDESSQLVRGSR